jgi:DNA-binding GntR family transcriptional regulator
MEARISLRERPESLTDMVYDAIREAILNKTLPPGGRVAEASLAEQLNVSKTPVREALLKLREIGLVEEVGRRGWGVIRPSITAVNEAYGAREALEVFAARSVAEVGDAEDIEAIAVAAQRSRYGARAGDPEAFRRWDFEFHRGIARATKNEMLARMLENVFALIVTLRQRDLPHLEFSAECADAHVKIAEAIAAHDVELTGAAMRDHVRQVRRYVLDNLPQQEAHGFAAA